jgi:hypothetical protein
MNAPQLPAYLQNKTRTNLNAVATAGIGGAMPNHISIRGNQFTLIDEAGNKMPLGPVMDGTVVDIADHIAKQYYEEDWRDGSDNPPDCWSMNGIGPSRESVKPQAATCGECRWNVRGSDTSKLSGKPIKACRDEKPVALLLPAYPNMLFRLVLLPGSFKNWASFTKQFVGGIDVSDVLIRFGFEPQKNGVLTFAVNGYIPEQLIPVFNQALAAKATDVLVGRTDVPIALPAPSPNAAALAAVTQQHLGAAQEQAANPAFGGQPAAQTPFGAAQPAMSATGAPASVQSAITTPAATEPARRHRRTKAEMEADRAKAATTAAPQQAPFPVNQQQTQPGFGAAQQPAQQTAPAGFGQPATTTQAPQQPASFGIQNGADPNVDPQLAAMLASLNPGQ